MLSGAVERGYKFEGQVTSTGDGTDLVYSTHDRLWSARVSCLFQGNFI